MTATNSDWEVLIDEGWIPFTTSSKFRDQPGTEQHVCLGQFWYALTFDSDGYTGKQKNLCTGKSRPLRRALTGNETSAISQHSTSDALSDECAESPSSISCPFHQESASSQAQAHTDKSRSVMQPTQPVTRVAAGTPVVLQDPAMPRPFGNTTNVTPFHGYATVQQTTGNIGSTDYRTGYLTTMPAACVNKYYYAQNTRAVSDPAMATRAHFVTRT